MFPPNSEIASVYNHLWRASDIRLAEVSGMLMFAYEGVKSPVEAVTKPSWNCGIKRYISRDQTGDLWTLKFNFMRSGFIGGNDEIFQKSYNPNKTPYLSKGKISPMVIEGDMEQFMRDWTILKLHDDIMRWGE